jgi:hypothetical protein
LSVGVVLGLPSPFVFERREVAKRAVQLFAVVLDSPVVKKHPGLENGLEELTFEVFVA